MILTKEQQEMILEKYIEENHNTDKCIGFVDGINATIELINKLTIDNETSTHYFSPSENKNFCKKCGKYLTDVAHHRFS